ncbi:MAG: TM2 domain-containing protein [Phycisphaerae bacterium]|nr:TM2 domain-containing protein [Phycisphaerae bacterium]
MGVLGVHRFYCGRVGSGLLWALTAGLVGIGWLIDLFLVPSMVREANARIMSQLRERGSSGLMPANHGGVPAPPASSAGETTVEHQHPTGLEPDHRVIYCTHCGAAMQVPTDAVGRQYGCPNCRTILVVPG